MYTPKQRGESCLDYSVMLLWVVIGVLILGVPVYNLAVKEITVKADGEIYQYKTLKPTVAAVLKEKGIILKPGDQVKPALKTSITADLQIAVERAFLVEIRTGKKLIKVRTVPQTVRNILTKAQITFDDNDEITPTLDQVILRPEKIKVVDISEVIMTKKVAISPKIEYLKDRKLERGKKKVVQKGRVGLLERQMKAVFADGKKVKEVCLEERLLKPAMKTIIAMGIKPLLRTIHTSRGTYRYREARTMVATAYSPGPESCGKYAVYGRTYTGKKAGYGIVAVDPKVIKLGTKLYVEGYGIARAEDIGGAIKGNRIDLCYETYREAIMFGKRKIKVYVLE